MVGFGVSRAARRGRLLPRIINWRSRDFNLKTQRRDIRLVDVPKGKPAVAPPRPAAGWKRPMNA